MRIVYERPPMFAEIDAAFHVAGKRVIFAWGDIIYNPMRIDVPPQLMAHEAMHGRRQMDAGIERWWSLYITDPDFRLDEEVRAHRAELAALLAPGANRNARRGAVKMVAKRLASPLYGGIITPHQARGLLLGAAA